jgi:membrane associated rhomboid family serine protease
MDQEVKRMIKSFLPGLALVAAFWLVKWLEIQSGYLLTEYGVLPRTWSGLKGVITSPFIHGDMKHLISNSLPLLVLLSGLFYFYKAMAYRVFAGIFFLGGIWLWIGGRESYHIGASGLVYGLTTFLFLSGVVRREARLMALSLLVVFLYGGMVWGVFPLFKGISWEAHLFGAFAGILFAIVYRKEGPQRKIYEWEKEGNDYDVDDGPDAYWKIPTTQVTLPPAPEPVEVKPEPPPVTIRYIYTTPEKPNSTDEKN